MKDGSKALQALLGLMGQCIYNLEGLTELLMEKGLIAEQEFDDAMMRLYLDERKDISPAQWARRCLSPEDRAALEDFFGGDAGE